MWLIVVGRLAADVSKISFVLLGSEDGGTTIFRNVLDNSLDDTT
jgi:hypothetical protein